MKPILFQKDAILFASNGLGRLDCMTCEVVEERNGMYELTLTIAETALHASEIEMSSIIVAKPAHNSAQQPFRVYKITKPINGKFTVYAQHISYQLSYIPTMPFTVAASASACNATLQALKNNAAESCPFTFQTDLTTVSSYTQKTPASIRSRLGGVEGSVLDQFGGEYEWDGYTVKLWRNRGLTVPVVSLRYGKNITDIEQEEEISNTVTGYCPFWMSREGDQIVTLPEKVVESQHADAYPFRRTIPLDLSENWEDAPTEAQLRAAAQAQVNKDGIGIPTVSIKVSFVDLSETEEYKDIMSLQSVKLCDRVKVEFERLGISTTAKVVRTEYDVLKEKYISIEVGSVHTSLAHTISSTEGAIDTALNKALFATQSATAWLTSANGYVHAVKNADGTWKELIFADTDDPNTWTNVLRINENGIGFSHDGGTTYSQAWTLDGKMVVGGTAMPSLTVYDANHQVLFQIDEDGVMWNAQYSSMTKNGSLSASDATVSGSVTAEQGNYKAVLEGGSLTFSYNDSYSGNIVAYSGSGTIEINADTALRLNASEIFINGTQAESSDTCFVRASNGEVWKLWFESGLFLGYEHEQGTETGIDATVYVRMSNGNVGCLDFLNGVLVGFDDNV